MKYLLLGMGKSNHSVARYFLSQGIDFVIYDDVSNKNPINIDEIDVVIKSPGVRNEHFLLKKAKKIICDLELFYRVNKNKTFITITGSNGKTTTVTLLKHLIDDIDLGGNVGVPLFDFTESDKDILIEASSFMLEHVDRFKSKYNVILNLYNTHLEYHKTYRNYLRSKLNLIKNSSADDFIIYNYDDKLLRRLVNIYEGIKIPFSREEKVGIHLEKNDIVYQGKKIASIKDISLIGKHNIENVLAAIAIILYYRGNIGKLSQFIGVEFRLEYCGKLGDLDVYNDSKSTNFKALYNALLSFNDTEVILIAGGKSQNCNFQIFNNLRTIKRCYFYGENRLEMHNFFSKKAYASYTYETLDEVFANLNTKDAKILLFSPGSLSFDQFSSYEERGKYFNKILSRYQ